MQLSSAAFRLLRSSGFQSSPVPEDGCNAMACRACSYPLMFQSSPVPEDGCNGFILEPWPAQDVFQSSPVPEDGCNLGMDENAYRTFVVSILTRFGGRVQPSRSARL